MQNGTKANADYTEQKCADTKYNWHNAGSLGWPFSVLKY